MPSLLCSSSMLSLFHDSCCSLLLSLIISYSSSITTSIYRSHIIISIPFVPPNPSLLYKMDPTVHMKNENESNAVDTTVVPKAKRRLSAFNLFYRFKRQKVIALQQSNQDANKDDITNLVQAAPGLEDYARGGATLPQDVSPEEVYNLRRANIHKEMEHNLAPRDTRTRSHRTDQNGINGSMSFVELGKLMNTSWKDCDDFAKSVFRELAEEGRRDYRQRLEKYNDYLSRNPHAAAAEDAKKNAKKNNKLAKKASSLPVVELKRHVSGYNYNSSAMTNEEEKSGHQSFRRYVSESPFYGNTAVPTGYSVYATNAPNINQSSSYETEEDLHASIKGLEDELSSVRLKLRVTELENKLARQKALEDQLRAQIQLSSLNSHVSQGKPPIARDLQRDSDGLILSLLHATDVRIRAFRLDGRNDSNKNNPDSSQGHNMHSSRDESNNTGSSQSNKKQRFS